jgi:hypothetical protein
MVVDVAGRGQGHDVTAVHRALIRQAQLGPAAVMANCVPPLMGLHSANRSDRHPAMVGVGVGHHPLGPVEQHHARTPFGLDQPLPPGRLGGYLRNQRTEILLIGGQLDQEQAYDARGALAVSVAGKTWTAPQVLRPFSGRQFEIGLPSRNQALQLYRVLVPAS